MPGYVIGKHGGIPESYLSHRRRCFFAVSHFLEDSSGVGGGVLALSVFQDHRAQVKFTIVSSHAHPFLYCLWLLPRCHAEWSSCTETYGPQG